MDFELVFNSIGLSCFSIEFVSGESEEEIGLTH
jgi:hypothetical protein